MEQNDIPEVTSNLRNNYVCVPEKINLCTGIYFFWKCFRSLIFTTDVEIIKNTNVDVYPLTLQSTITQAILSVLDIPVICGVGGGITYGIRSVNIVLHAQFQGAIGVVFKCDCVKWNNY